MEPSSSSSSSLLDRDLRLDLYAALAALGLSAFLAVCFWRLYRLTVSARPQDMLPTAAGASGGKAAALRQKDVAALPVFVHGGGDADAVECPVCLAEMKDGERGRLLPVCGHRFHVECIDRWFRANSTCPVCRAAAVGQPDAVPACKGGSPQVMVVVQS
ncbi:E3 ubiquitin-protein ligase EL5-like [Panicum miliaceum]|uniref:RING-type E3 ubiquitin transferase n=1 Tax=Panicum miliaceum TaxID=4540 RepID=A0A3L6TQ35_PANMI|nr:E3 ubiquitin-protein ligase EL5-like [Panicum miliaceum]